jgi:hypothetical protein
MWAAAGSYQYTPDQSLLEPKIKPWSSRVRDLCSRSGHGVNADCLCMLDFIERVSGCKID